MISAETSMSPNRRIFLNIVATYGRSLYALVIGLFCGRWTLIILGAYGVQSAHGVRYNVERLFSAVRKNPSYIIPDLIVSI